MSDNLTYGSSERKAKPRTITAWVCDECDYWRQDRSTGVHQTLMSRRNAVHMLREATFVEVRDA